MKAQETFIYNGVKYPDYIRKGNAVENIIPIAKKFCIGIGLDIGGTPEWHFPKSRPVNNAFAEYGPYDALNCPDIENGFDYIFSSHCLEHIPNYILALEYWKSKLAVNGQLFLYLPHPDMEYWQPQNCRKHLHSFDPAHMVKVLEILGFEDIFCSGRDLYWSFAVTGRKS